MKKILCMVLLTAFLCVGLITVDAAADVSVWDGATPDVSTGYSFLGLGTQENPYQITTAEDLAAMAALVNRGNDYDGYFFELTVDIDLAGKDWTSIGYAPLKNYNYISLDGATPFCGTFDGNNHSISNLSNIYIGDLTSPTNGYTYGLFGYIKGAVLKNLAVLNAKIEGYGLLGIACGTAQSNTKDKPTIIENVFVTGEITASLHNTGALLGRGLGVDPEASKYTTDGSIPEGMYIRSCYTNVVFSLDMLNMSTATVNLFIGTVNGCKTGNMVTATIHDNENGCVVNSGNNGSYSVNRSGYPGAEELSKENFGGLLNAFLTNSTYEPETTTPPETTPPPETTEPPETTTPPETSDTDAPETTTLEEETTKTPETTVPVVNDDDNKMSSGRVVLIVILSLALIAAVVIFIIRHDKMIRIISITLVVILIAGILATVLTSKKPLPNGPDDTGTDTTEGEDSETEPLYDDKGFLLDQLPKDLNYENTKVSFLCWDGQAFEEFAADATDGDLISNALLNRNYAVEERLGVELNFTKTKGGSSEYDLYLAEVNADVMSGAHEYNILAAYSRTTALCAYNGFTQDLQKYKYLNLQNPWWPDTLIDSSTINDKLYFCTGDISISLFHNMAVIYFNKTLTEKAGITDTYLYKTVFDGDWTLDLLIELSSGMYYDLNANGIKDDKDQFGYMASNTQSQILLWGSEIKAINIGNGKMEIDPSWTSEKMDTILTKLLTWSTSNSLYLNKSGNTPFAENRLAFFGNVATYYMSTFNKEELTVGILPPPKYTADQEDYISVMGNTITLYAISAANNEEDGEMCSAVLECMGSEGYRQLTPVIFETAMKYKYAADDTVSKIYDLIRAAIYYDHGRIYSGVFDNLFTNTYNVYIGSDGGTGWMSSMTSVKPKLQSLIDSVNSGFENN